MMVDWIQSPWTQPFGRRDLDEDPPRLVDLPFAFSDADAFFARSSAAVFSLAMVASETREERLGGGESERVGRRRREQRENAEALLKKTLAGRIYKVPSEWMTGGPVDLIISGSSYADGIRGEKGGAEIEASMPRPIRTPRSAPLRARPQISHPAVSASNKSVCQARCFRRSVARRSS